MAGRPLGKSNTRWKQDERRIAKEIGATRNPNNGKVQLDICAGHFGIEHKSLAKLPKWALDAVDQVKNGINKTCPCGKHHDCGIVVITGREPSKGKVKRLVVMDWEDWKNIVKNTAPELEMENVPIVEKND